MKKTLFAIHVDNHIDLITNSSSELFVLNGETLETVEEMIKEVYPDYRNEYDQVVCLRDAEPGAIDTYFSWVESPWHDNNYYRLSEEEQRQKTIEDCVKTAERFGMAVEEFYSNWDVRHENKWFFPHETEAAFKKIAKVLDPDGKIYLLLSIDENPNWEMQDALSSIGTRYHLG